VLVIRPQKESTLPDALVPSPLIDHPLIARLRSLRLDNDDMVLFGSAPLLAHGLRDRISDLDVVARGRAWRRACELGERLTRDHSGTELVRFCDGLIEISTAWITPRWSADELIDGADVIDGLRFARLDQVLAYKRQLRRPKDIPDIETIERVLGLRAATH
jgi:hypothetical protein